MENLKRFIYTNAPPPRPEFFFCVCKAWSIKRQEQNVKKKYISQHLVTQCRGIFFGRGLEDSPILFCGQSQKDFSRIKLHLVFPGKVPLELKQLHDILFANECAS